MIEANSTVTAVSYTNDILNMSVSQGIYLEALISTAVLANPENLTVIVNGAAKQYSIVQQDDWWKITVTD
jgi:hypothetical protein